MKMWLPAVVVVIVDQVSKWYVEQIVQPLELPVISGFFTIVCIHNYGSAFGFFQGWRFFLIAVGFAVLCVLLYMWKHHAQGQWRYAIPLGFIIGGAVGNAIDRVRFGYVIDFLDFFIGSYHWPAFNVADTAICLGTIYIIIVSIFTHNKT